MGIDPPAAVMRNQSELVRYSRHPTLSSPSTHNNVKWKTSGHMTLPAPPPPPSPCPLWDAEIESTAAALSTALTSGCHLEMSPPPTTPSHECWVIGRASSGSSLFLPLCRNDAAPFTFRLSRLLSSRWLQLTTRSENNLPLTIPLKLRGCQWPILRLFFFFILEVFKALSQFPTFQPVSFIFSWWKLQKL